MILTLNTIQTAARAQGYDPAAILSVIHVETPAPHEGDLEIDGEKKPLILNERHWMYKLTPLPLSKTRPDLSNKKPGGYCTGRGPVARQRCEHQRLDDKMALDPKAALGSISMGLFQVMGFNAHLVGYRSVFDMWADALKVDDRIDLLWFFRFVKNTHLDDELRRLDWRGFARGYNGPNYRINDYHSKLALFYTRFAQELRHLPPAEEQKKQPIIISDLRRMVGMPPDMHPTPHGFPDFSQITRLAA